MIYLQLFISFFQIGLFSIGGGYAALPLIQEQVVANHQWLTNLEYTDLITISQMTPGPIAINSATFVGDQIASSGISILITAFWGEKGVTANLGDLNYIAIVLFALSLIILRKFKPNPIYVMLGTGGIGMIIYLTIA